MASAFYNSVVSTVAAYVGEAKAPGLVERQLKHCSSTADQFAQADLKKILVNLMGAANLYIPEAPKQDELRNKLQAMAP